MQNVLLTQILTTRRIVQLLKHSEIPYVHNSVALVQAADEVEPL